MITKGQKIRELHFALGALFALGFYMAFQDWFGLEGYVEYVRTNWTDFPWWLGATIAAVCFGMNRWLVYKQGKDDERRQEARDYRG